MAEPRKRNLSKDQEKLAEAARDKINSSVDDKLLNPLIATEVAASTSKYLNTPRDVSKIVNSPLVQNTNRATDAISKVGRVANTSPIKAPVVSSLTSPLFAYAIANELTGAMTEDGRDLNTIIGEGIGGAIGESKYGDGSLPAFSLKERKAMQDGLNVNKPIFETLRSGRKKIVGYEPLSQGAKNDLAREDDMVIESPRNRDRSPIRATFTLPDGTVVQEREDGTRFTPTQEQLQGFNRMMGQLNQPSVTGLGVGGSEGVIVNKGNPSDPYGFTPQAPEVEGTGMSRIADKMLADFQRFKDSGRELTPEMRQKATDLAASVGRRFDPENIESGYSDVFEPEILEKYNQRVADGNFDPSTIGREERPSNLDLALQERREAQAQSDQSFEANRGRMEEDRRDREESGGAMIRVDGVQVPATKANREKRDLENRLKEEARDLGLSEAGVRNYVREKLEERESALNQKEIDRIKDDLDISTKAAELEKKRQDLIPDAPPRPKPSEIKSFISNAEDQFDLVFDPETFTFNTVEDGGFWGSDKEHPLNPNSELYKKLKQVQGSEYFLSPPSDVMNILEQSIEDAKKSPLGYVGVQADDGRVYNITAGGDITHVGYSSEEIK